MQACLRIGTRGSPLALAQAHDVRDRLAAAHPSCPPAEVVVIRTTGDMVQDRPLSEIGGKGLFTKEIEEALVERRIDLAVHSMKDVATVLPARLGITCFLEREDPRDALIGAAAVAAIPAGATVGTASLRRGAQLRLLRPDLAVATLRGNVGTRLKRIAAGDFAATFLAYAGLKRLGLAARADAVIEPEIMLPALAQGAIGVETRLDDAEVLALLAPLDHAPTRAAVTMERAFLARLDGSCRTPIAGLARAGADGRLAFRGEILAPDGSARFACAELAAPHEAAAVARDAAERLLARAPAGFLRP